MTKNASYEEKFKKYLGASARFEIDPKSKGPKAENLEVLKEALEHVGINLKYKGDTLDIEVDSNKYIKACTRYAGPKDKKRKFATNKVGIKGDTVQYSDVIFMLQTMTDKEIMTELNMPYATYYRHKKAMLNSDYYKSLDANVEWTEDYLDTIFFNETF